MTVRRFRPPSVPPLGEKWRYCHLCGEGDSTNSEGRKWPEGQMAEIDGVWYCPAHTAMQTKYDIDIPLELQEDEND